MSWDTEAQWAISSSLEVRSLLSPAAFPCSGQLQLNQCWEIPMRSQCKVCQDWSPLGLIYFNRNVVNIWANQTFCMVTSGESFLFCLVLCQWKKKRGKKITYLHLFAYTKQVFRTASIFYRLPSSKSISKGLGGYDLPSNKILWPEGFVIYLRFASFFSSTAQRSWLQMAVNNAAKLADTENPNRQQT